MSIYTTEFEEISGKVVSVLQGQDPDGHDRPIHINSAGALEMSDFMNSVALGQVPNYRVEVGFGRNGSIDIASTPEDVWNGGGLYNGQPAGFTPETVDIVSDDLDDTPTGPGTGAHSIRIVGLRTSTSTSYETEDINLNGTTPVTSTNTWYRVISAHVLTAGTTGSNEGTITISATTSSNVFAIIDPGFNQSSSSVYTVPTDRTMLFKRLRIVISKNAATDGNAVISMRVREPGGVYRAVRIMDVTTNSPTQFTDVGGEVIPAGSDLKFTIESVTDNGTSCNVAFEFILVNNNIL